MFITFVTRMKYYFKNREKASKNSGREIFYEWTKQSSNTKDIIVPLKKDLKPAGRSNNKLTYAHLSIGIEHQEGRAGAIVE